MAESTEKPTVIHQPDNQRFELALENHLAVLEYYLANGIITFTHTGVPAELGGRGLGSLLARAGLDYARANQLKVVPQCSFIAAYIEKHPEDQNLLQA